MSGKDTYVNFRELHRKIGGLLDQLDRGELPMDQLEDLADLSRDLHERLIVLRYKAYDQLVNGTQEVVEEKEEAQPMLFSLDAIEEPAVEPQEPEEEEAPTNQTSLIDAIEEIEETSNEEELPEEVTEGSVVEEEGPQSVHQQLSLEHQKDSLGNKLQTQPIVDLKKAIGLNQKFRFINDLFEGEAERYESAIEALNTAPGIEEAMNAVQSLKEELGWDEESPSTVQIIQLVERRHA